MRQVTTKLLSHITIEAHDNATTLQQSRFQAFIGFRFAVWGYLHSQANFVALQHEICKQCIMREKNDTMCVSVSYV